MLLILCVHVYICVCFLSTGTKSGMLPGDVGDVASGILRTASAYLDEKFQLSILKIIMDLKATVEALEIAPPELVLASPILSEALLSSFLKSAKQVSDSKKIEEGLKRAGVWQLASTLSPLAPPPTVTGSGCPMNCGNCGACAAFASDVYALSQAPPFYATLRAPGFYFPSPDETNRLKENKKSKDNGVSIGVRKTAPHHHHHHTHHTQDGQVFENVWDDDGFSTGSDSSSSNSDSDSPSSDMSDDDDEEEGGSGRKRGVRRGNHSSGMSDDDIIEEDLIDEDGELIVG
jgi:hypothetical protein